LCYNALVTSLPRIPLRNIFVLFACAAVGLATYPDPLSALEPAVATAIIIGLAQQIWQFRQTAVPQTAERELRFARSYAIVWRLLAILVIAASIGFELLRTRGFVNYLDLGETMLISPIYYIGSVCVVLVLVAGVAKWRSKSASVARVRWLPVLFVVLGVFITLTMIAGDTTLEFLVHQALANIEAAQPVKFQRADVYPKLGDESYVTLWIAAAAVLCVGLSLIVAGRLRSGGFRSNNWKLVLVFALLLPAIAFCYWYYHTELARLSPEIAVAGLTLNWVDGVFGVAIGALLAAFGAYQVARNDTVTQAIATLPGEDVGDVCFYESAPCLAMMSIQAVSSLWFYFSRELLDFGGGMFTPTVGTYLSTLCYPLSLLTLASAAVKFQLCWYRWKYRASSEPWRMRGVDPAAFGQAWLAFAVILTVAIPSLRAFAFILWLGPIDLLWVFGLR
jgi:hypothetical protein